jgi:hypothetical protein
MHNNNNRARKHACRSRAGDRSPDNKRRRIRRRAADQRADLEEQDRGHVDAFCGVEGVDLAEEEHEGAAGEEEGGAVPGDVGEGVEVVGDAGDGGCDDCAVLKGWLVLEVCWREKGLSTRATRKTAR